MAWFIQLIHGWIRARCEESSKLSISDKSETLHAREKIKIKKNQSPSTDNQQITEGIKLSQYLLASLTLVMILLVLQWC